jgi:glycosyltransferase involved in cell wall biosynthesis
MKICYLSQSFYPYVGGVSDYLRDLGRELTKKGIEVHELSFKTHDTPSSEDFEGIKIHRFLGDASPELLGNYGKFKENILKATHKQAVEADALSNKESHGWNEYMEVNTKAKEELLTLHELEKFDIIHIQDFQFLPMGRILRESVNVPLAFTWHIPFIPEIPGEWKGFFVDYMKEYDNCVLSTDEYYETAISAGLSKEKCTRIHPFVDLRRYEAENRAAAFKKKYGLEENRIILCVSRLDPRKGQPTLIKALPEVVKALPDAKAVFVGNGSITKEMIGGRSKVAEGLKTLASENGVENNVIFTGYIEEEELKGAFEAADAVIQPSHMEAFGLTVTQAMSFAKPVIGTNVGGIKVQILNEKTGHLFEPGDHDTLSSLLLQVLKNPETAIDMGRAGKQRIREIADVKVGLAAHLEMYNSLKE